MKWIALVGMAAAGALAWQIGSRLSSDAISMALGVAFGVLAGVPTAILVMAGQRRQEPPRPPQQAPAPQPPVIVIHGGQALPQDVRHHLVMPTQADNFYEVEPEHSRDIVRRGRL